MEQIPVYDDAHSSKITSEQLQTSDFDSLNDDRIAIDANNSTELLFNKTAQREDILGAVKDGIH